jgi:hypothetical protein
MCACACADASHFVHSFLPVATVGDLLTRMLDKDPALRATLEEVRAHPWLLSHVPDAAAPAAAHANGA